MILFSTKVESKYVTAIIDKELDKLFGEEHQEINKILVKLKRVGDTTIASTSSSVLEVKLPIAFNIKKGEGIFTSEVNGSVEVELHINYDISPDFTVSLSSKINGYEWINHPKLEIGSLSIPVENLVEMVLKYYEDTISDNIDNSLKKAINIDKTLEELVTKLEGTINENIPYGLGLDIDLQKVFLKRPAYNDDVITVEGALSLKMHVSNSAPVPYERPEFVWADSFDKANLGFVSFDVPFTKVEEVLIEESNKQVIGGKPLKVESVKISYESSLKVKSKVISPLESEADFSCQPTYNESDSKLYLNNIELALNPASFFYKIPAKLFTPIITNQIEELFPFDIKQFIDVAKAKINSTTIDQPNIKANLNVLSIVLAELVFNTQGITGRVRYEGLNADIAVK